METRRGQGRRGSPAELFPPSSRPTSAGSKKRSTRRAGPTFNINSPQQLSAMSCSTSSSSAATRKTRGDQKLFDGRWTSSRSWRRSIPSSGMSSNTARSSKLKSTYADALVELIDPATGRIHTSYNQTVASTGRLSSSDPNLQNIPARGEMGQAVPEGLRSRDRLFVSRRPTIPRSSSGCSPTCPETRPSSRPSQPAATSTRKPPERVFGPASALFKDEQRRRKAKIINFSILYGTSAFSLAKQIETSNARRPGVHRPVLRDVSRGSRNFWTRIVEEARTRGYSETIFGRKRQVPELRSPGQDPPAGRPPDRAEHARSRDRPPTS